MPQSLRYILCSCIFTMLFIGVYGQKDSTKKKTTVKTLAHDVYKSFVKVEGKREDSTFLQKSEASFKPYEGKGIRHIYIVNLSFSENVLDTSRNIISTLTRVADGLQSNTKDWVIREMLFVKKGQALDPYRLADNERFLRDQNFIKDARIVVRPVEEYPDSVDLYVRLRDVFSWGAEINTSGINNVKTSIYDANFLGMAQRLQYTLLYDKNRNPITGSEIRYRKTSVVGSFINLEAAYTTINQGGLATENETAYFLSLDRPLYTPNARFAGGLQLSKNRSTNVFEKPVPLFRDYKYQLGDVWLGYNIGVNKQKRKGSDDRSRRFVSVRYFNQHFDQLPKLDTFDLRYTNKRYVLGQFTWYKIDFYKTNYIYGFGRTEDLPVGMTRKVTIGPVQVDSLRRMYAGFEFDHWLVDKNENYWEYTLALGTNYYKKEWQDNSTLLNIGWYSRLMEFPRVKIRQYSNFSYAGIYNQHVYDPLHINNEFGLDEFGSDSIRARQRLSMGTETDLYTRWNILGFKIGFLAFAKATLMTPQQLGYWRGGLFPALGGGIRTRNENLIFGTIEARLTWFPHTLFGVNNFTINIRSNLRVKFTGSFVQAPWFALVK
ncbi:hypothetical protein A4H97_16860 [Niastella yeongjuensis]|uniref:Bacterial surface antigen (D15) domain-containing protein n=1 Tax=Niastella yeongjuensis TaxID=354355 RepID=A0A1V9E1A3_9BACT|nr:hypothetical protein [Niastella yeongjuensis]OQP39890.1 hypothetical protein A4H97_16860 [Niastella yeongjuensis]SEO09096.1 hypothetical protein SAMN05660816_02117 [Niastella yeongjuensis]